MNWFKFYYTDWNKDEVVKDMVTAEQVGAYWLLLVHQMGEGSIPDDMSRLARYARVADVDRFVNEIWPHFAMKFSPVEGQPGRLYNPKCARVMAEADSFRQAGSEGGKRSAEVRRERAVSKAMEGDQVDQTVLDGDVRYQALLEAAGDAIVQGPVTAAHLQVLSGYNTAQLKVVGEYVAAGEHWLTRKSGVSKFTLQKLLASNFGGTVSDALSWDDRDRMSEEEFKMPKHMRPCKPIPKGKGGRVDL